MNKLCRLIYSIVLLVSMVTYVVNAQDAGGNAKQTTTTTTIDSTSKTIIEEPLKIENQHFSWLLAVGLMGGFPQGEFKSNIPRFIPLGFDIYAGYSPLQIVPFAFGLDVSTTNYGNENKKQILLDNTSVKEVNVQVTNSILNVHSFIRLQPDMGYISPYIEALIGVNHLYTTSETWYKGKLVKDSPYDVSSDFNNNALCYGPGIGLSVKQFSLREKMSNGKIIGYEDAVYFDVRLRYLFGGRIQYLKQEGVTTYIDLNGDYITIYKPSESGTDMIYLLFGLSFKF